jgi:phage repressor protein C with HTH and peptisase S24 domain
MLTGKKLGAAIASALALKKRGSQARLADALGIRPPSVSELKETGRIDKSKLPTLWHFFSDVVGPEHWGLERYPWGNDEKQDFVEIPLIDAKLSAGTGSLVFAIDSDKTLSFRAGYLKKKRLKEGKRYTFPVSGNSMVDKHIIDGSTVLIDGSKTVPASKGIYALWIDDEIFIKELVEVDDGKWVARSHNNAEADKYPDIPIKTESNGIIGLVVWCGFDL